jgi:heterodisulfide reductase subunit A
VRKFLDGTISRVRDHKRIKVYLNAHVNKVGGHVGDFTSTLATEHGSDSIRHGVVVLATGATELKPQTYGFGQSSRILTQLELTDRLGRGEIALPENATIAMIQCVEQRSEERPYCSRVCCTTAVKNALLLKERYPQARIIVPIETCGRTVSARRPIARPARKGSCLSATTPRCRRGWRSTEPCG